MTQDDIEKLKKTFRLLSKVSGDKFEVAPLAAGAAGFFVGQVARERNLDMQEGLGRIISIMATAAMASYEGSSEEAWLAMLEAKLKQGLQ
jgi:hypothetical protein